MIKNMETLNEQVASCTQALNDKLSGNRSSSAAATISPSRTKAAADPWYNAEIPSMFILPVLCLHRQLSEHTV